jgi:hypothetical protein
MENHMRQLPHFPSKIPDEPLNIRRIYLPPGNGPREDEVVKLDWCGRAMTMDDADAFLREELPRSGAHAVRIETKDGEFIRERTVWNTIRERFVLAPTSAATCRRLSRSAAATTKRR